VKKSLLIVHCASLIVVVGCNSDESQHPRLELLDALTFFASFDGTTDADHATGDRRLFVAPSWNARADLAPHRDQFEHVEIAAGEGRYGDALWMDNRHQPIYAYRGERNIDHVPDGPWEGTLSFWMRLDPDQDLHEGYSDPIQITPRGWNDAALFVDFTDEPPRAFRFAAFADRDVWDPQRRNWGDVPEEEHPFITVAHPPFSHDAWTHVVLTFSRLNTGAADGQVQGYLGGRPVGSLEDRELTFSWPPDEVLIWLGYNFRGYLDELALFDRALSDQEVATLHELEGGIAASMTEIRELPP
jgi:hypothetical protein